jgi:hypothetical protein
MSLINELKEKSNNADNVKQEIIEEIKNYFDKYLDEGLENYLKRRIGNDEIKQRKVYMSVAFWGYRDGCSTTSFSCGGEYWYNPEVKDGYKSHYYRSVELRTLDKEVCSYLSSRLEERMCELGFTLVSKERKDCWLNYYDMQYYFGW